MNGINMILIIISKTSIDPKYDLFLDVDLNNGYSILKRAIVENNIDMLYADDAKPILLTLVNLAANTQKIQFRIPNVILDMEKLKPTLEKNEAN